MTQTTTLPELELATINNQVAAGLKRVQEVMKQIDGLKEKSLTIKIKDANDKQGYIATKEFLSEVRPIRTGLESERKVCVKPLNDVVDNINAMYKTATSALVGIESSHKPEKEEYEAAIEQKKLDEAAQAEKIITDKINLLIKNGLEYNPNNGMYEIDFNGKMVSVGRLDVVNMESTRFEQLIERASGIKEEKEKSETEKLRAQQILQERKNSLALLGMNFVGLDGYKITELETGGEVMISQEELSNIGDEDFVTLHNKISELADNNKKYTASIKEAADKLAKDKADLQTQQEKLKRDKITVLQNRLGAEGFKFFYGSPLETSVFSFANQLNDSIVVKIADILDNEQAVLKVIKEAHELVEKEKQHLNSLEEKKQNEEKLNTEKALKEKDDKEKKEAAKKVDSKKDLALIVPHINKIKESMGAIGESKFKVIEEYSHILVSEMLVALDKFRNSVKHLSS